MQVVQGFQHGDVEDRSEVTVAGWLYRDAVPTANGGMGLYLLRADEQADRVIIASPVYVVITQQHAARSVL
jgi:hypothetical protein